MTHPYDSTGVDLTKPQLKLLPDGTYTFSVTGVTEKESSKGNYMVSVKASVINNPEHNGKWVYHNVTFLDPKAKGAGMAIHFLKTIGQPWEGQFDIDPNAWLGQVFMGTVGTEEYKGRKTNKITAIEDVVPF